MDEVMTMEEIQSRFHSEWVLLEDPEVDNALTVKRGKVLWHSKSREEVDRKALKVTD